MTSRSSPCPDPPPSETSQLVERRRKHTPDGLARLRAAALANQPWRFSTGPRTPEGKAKVAENGRKHRKGPISVRERRRQVAAIRRSLEVLAELRRQLGAFDGNPDDSPDPPWGEARGNSSSSPL